MLTDTLDLINPLVFLDVASTELNLSLARIVRISTIKLLPDGTRIFVTHLINPTVKISRSASKIHGVKAKDVMNEKPFINYAESISNHLAGCDLVGFGIKRYGLPLLRKEFRKSKIFFSTRNRSVIDLMNIYHRVEPRDYKSAYNRFTKNTLKNYYDSKKRVEGMVDIFSGQLEEFSEIPSNISEIVKWMRR